jgi:hypothetical protein
MVVRFEVTLASLGASWKVGHGVGAYEVTYRNLGINPMHDESGSPRGTFPPSSACLDHTIPIACHTTKHSTWLVNTRNNEAKANNTMVNHCLLNQRTICSNFPKLEFDISMEKHLEQQGGGWDPTLLVDKPPINGWGLNPNDGDPPSKLSSMFSYCAHL